MDFTSSGFPAIDLDVLARITQLRATCAPTQLETLRTLEQEIENKYQASTNFAVYGSSGPNRPNHHHIADIRGTWQDGIVRGELVQAGWGATMGFPALTWSAEKPTSAKVAVQLLQSPLLPSAWQRLDAFEGNGYLRILVPVEVEGSPPFVANLYSHAATVVPA